MKKILFSIVALLITTQASAGTAFVLQADSGMNLMYNAPDSADDTEPFPDISICDAEFNLENCMDLNSINYNPNSNVNRYEDLASNCVISITKSETKNTFTEVVTIVSGAESCKTIVNGKLESVARTYTSSY